MEKRDNKLILFIVIGVLAIILIIFTYFKLNKKETANPENNIKVENDNKYLAYRITSNSLENFDLYFLKLENEKKNKVYSPLSIKYALQMLNDGATGKTKEQISNIVGTYKSNKYTNSKYMSFANGLFIKDSYKNNIKAEYVSKLSNKYNAEVIYDSFQNPKTINNWVSDKTFNLINNISDDISEEDFILVNALAIDMDWVNKIRSEKEDYSVSYDHEDFSKYISSLEASDYEALDFNNKSLKAKALEIGGVVNKYDIINVLGEENIRENIKNKYQAWLDGGAEGACGSIEEELDVPTYVNKYIEEISANYQKISSSTDFYFNTNEEVKVFAKDLREYNGTTLQYVGIMPTNVDLDTYVDTMTAENINKIINGLKSIDLKNFKDGVITEITGYIPMFKFDYELNLMDDLKQLGIIDIFDSKIASLSDMTKDNAAINKTSHKTNIEFSNEGIKAAAATAITGAGAGDCGFDYLYEVPVEKIDLTFDKPYLFLIRDKDTGEVWFAGTVYEPIENPNE